MRPLSVFAGALALLLSVPLPALGQDADDVPNFVGLEAFNASHPDLFWRRAGTLDYERGRHAEAMLKFRRAARYADKAAQAMIAQMLWNGDGVAADRALAYAWADLAAERGYPRFIATRERFWNELDAGKGSARRAKARRSSPNTATRQPSAARTMRSASPARASPAAAPATSAPSSCARSCTRRAISSARTVRSTTRPGTGSPSSTGSGRTASSRSSPKARWRSAR